MAERTLPQRLWYDFMRSLCRLTAVVCFRVRANERQYMPAEGGGIILSNHQSHLDPVLIGIACNRRLNYLARKTLFDIVPLRWLINSLNAIPLDRDGMGLGGLKETLRRLKQGEPVLIFPEGRRTEDGQVASLKPGFCSLARRARVPLVPVGIAGAFDAWPRWQKFPSAGVIHVEFGPPLCPQQVAQLDDQQLIAEVESRLRACQHHAALTRGLGGGPLAPASRSSD